MAIVAALSNQLSTYLAGLINPSKVILLTKMTSDQINNLSNFGYYALVDDVGSPYLNIKAVELPSSDSYITGGKTITGTQSVISVNGSTYITIDTDGLTWTNLTATVYGFAIIDTSDKVIFVEYNSTGIQIATDDFKLSWPTLNNSTRYILEV